MSQSMAENPRSPAGGGIFIVLGVAGGVVVGRLYGQTSIGLIAGLSLGVALATLIWWRGR
jgi:hypothetical protein